ncbi:MAG: propionyl-CoA synthetase [Proteobacteria bacterium]|nr:propionyl-CoA synthetase [Pseudomonadota bacterium]
MANAYDAAYRRSMDDPSGFWADAAAGIDWTRKWDKVLDDTNPPFYRWFTGGELNTCFNCLDRHVAAGRGAQAALIYHSPVTGGSKRTYSYKTLLDEVAKTAGALKAEGVQKGDRVVIYMPMIPEAAIAMLSCARLGAIHSVVFGGFASNELAVRIDDAKPKVIMSATCGIEVNRVLPYIPLLDGAINMAKHKPDACLIFKRPELDGQVTATKHVDWTSAVAKAQPAECVAVKATDPLYILYTSGTTGEPKGVVRDNGGHAVALKWSMKNIYDIDPGDVFWAASDVGWVVGHSYIVYAPLLHGATTVMFEGKPVGTPDPGAFWRVISEHGVKALFTAPTAFRAIKKEDPNATQLKKYDLSRFKMLFLAGERTDPDTLEWAQSNLGVPVVDHWWQTETGWAIATNCMGLHRFPIKPGSPTKPAPGWNVQVLDEETHQPVKAGTIGAICVKLPMPPSSLQTLWNADQRYLDAYINPFPGYYKTADAGMYDDEGYIYIMARTDDIINVAGHRLSTGGMEEVLASHPDVAECAVIGVADLMKGQLPFGFLVLKDGVKKEPDVVVSDVVKLVRERIGPVAAFKQAVVVKRLPKTRSGKILRGTMQKIADNEAWKMPATIDDPVILDEITVALEGAGYGKSRQT